MGNWLSPNVGALREVISASKGKLLLCTPYVSTPALNVVAGALPKAVSGVEFWTKLNQRDWLTGASDLEGLLHFVNEVEQQTGPVAIRHADSLHAKIIISDGSKAIAGSANLTAGGYMNNIEVARVVMGREVNKLRAVVSGMRPSLQGITQEQFADFVSVCTAKVDSKEALLDLIRGEAPLPLPGPGSLVRYKAFLDLLESETDDLAIDILPIAKNQGHNNNTGKVRQAFYGVQRFLQEYPGHRETVESLPLQWFDVMESGLASDWIQFLDDFSDEVNPDYEYSMPTLRGYLPERYGGTLTGGGGGSNELKRVWPFVGRALRGTGV